jgi:uncharacterized 2Fe-2S/4Fe-4S cluster protein (DUF4445 family)
MKSDRKVIFHQKKGKAKAEARAETGKTLWDHARVCGLEMPHTCGGQGKCGKCRVTVEKGMDGLAGRTEVEREFPLEEDERLACQAKVVSDAQDIHVMQKTAGQYSILTDSLDGEVTIDPFVYRKENRVFHRDYPHQSQGEFEGELLGLAVDVGTTTLVVQLVDLENGRRMATSARKNPQVVYGDDVITRIGYADQDPNGLSRLQVVVVEAVNTMMQEIEEKIGRSVRGHITEAVVVGNPVMRNLVFGLGVHSLGQSPFEPDDTSSVYMNAETVGLEIHPQAKVYGAPLVAGQVGADCLAGILACDIHEREKPCMMVDIGTNGEVAIGNRERILSASNAAGCAFEGATVSCGVGAIEGAVKSIRIQHDEIIYQTIGDTSPVGICGSGLIDALAEMMKAGILDETGKFSGSFKGTKAFTIVDHKRRLEINQKDINELRLARAGLVLNQKTLVRTYGIGLDQLEAVFLVGGFGNYVNIDNAIDIGILPDRKESIVKIGNGALAGARQMLLSQARREAAERLASEIEHVTLFDQENLLDVYVDELNLHRWP